MTLNRPWRGLIGTVVTLSPLVFAPIFTIVLPVKIKVMITVKTKRQDGCTDYKTDLAILFRFRKGMNNRQLHRSDARTVRGGQTHLLPLFPRTFVRAVDAPKSAA